MELTAGIWTPQLYLPDPLAPAGELESPGQFTVSVLQHPP